MATPNTTISMYDVSVELGGGSPLPLVTYNTATTHTYTVPSGVTRLYASVVGGGGGAGGGDGGGTGYSGYPGKKLVGFLDVTPGDTIIMNIGGGGGGGSSGATGSGGGSAGYSANGYSGGRGGNAGGSGSSGAGGGGGGATTLAINTAGNIKVIAGGGGGGGGSGNGNSGVAQLGSGGTGVTNGTQGQDKSGDGGGGGGGGGGSDGGTGGATRSGDAGAYSGNSGTNYDYYIPDTGATGSNGGSPNSGSGANGSIQLGIASITLNDTNVRKLANVSPTWTTSNNYTSVGSYTYVVPDGVKALKVVTNGKTKYLSVTPGQSLSVTVGSTSSNNSIGSLNFIPANTVLGSWSGNVDAQINVAIQMITASGTAWSSSGGQGTLSSAASAVGAYYAEFSEGSHGDLSATVSMNPLTSSELIDGTQTLTLINKNVRGSADVTVQPTTANSGNARIYMTDGGYSEGYFYFDMNLQYNTNLQIYTSPYEISLNDLKNKTWVVNYAGASSSTVTYNACFGYSLDRKLNGDIALTVGYWGSAGTGSWTQLRDYSGTGTTSNYGEVAKFVLTNSNAGTLYATGASGYVTGPCNCIFSNPIYAYGQDVGVGGAAAPGAAWMIACEWDGTRNIKIWLNPSRNGTGDTGTTISMGNMGQAFGQLAGSYQVYEPSGKGYAWVTYYYNYINISLPYDLIII